MNEIVLNGQGRRVPVAIDEFTHLRDRLRDPAETRALNVRTGEGDEVRRSRVVVPATLVRADLERLKLLADAQFSTPSRKDAEGAAVCLMAPFSPDRYSNAKVMFQMLTQLLEASPAPAVAALVNIKDPKSYARQSQFPPNLAEVSQWLESFMRSHMPSTVAIAELLRGLASLEKLQALPGFQIEEERA